MKPYRNKKIGEYLRGGSVACCITGQVYAIVNHHLIGNGYSGMGTKAPDYLQCALTHELHSELHNRGHKAFEIKYGHTQKSMVAQTMAKLHADGVIDLNQIDIDEKTMNWLTEEMELLAYEK